MFQQPHDEAEDYLSKLDDEEILRSYFYIKKNVERLPVISSLSMLKLLYQFRHHKEPMYELYITARRSMQKLEKEMLKRRIN